MKIQLAPLPPERRDAASTTAHPNSAPPHGASGHDTHPDTQEAIGARLRALRRERKLSLAELAARAGASVGMISQIERNLSNPSVRMLERLRTALGVPLTTLLESDDPRADTVVDIVRRADARPHFSVGPTGLSKELLSPHGDHDLQFMVITIPPGTQSGEVLLGPGEKAGLVLEGEMTLTVGERHEVLGPGDSFQFKSAIPHAVHNPGAAPTRVLWIMNTRPPVVQL